MSHIEKTFWSPDRIPPRVFFQISVGGGAFWTQPGGGILDNRSYYYSLSFLILKSIKIGGGCRVPLPLPPNKTRTREKREGS